MEYTLAMQSSILSAVTTLLLMYAMTMASMYLLVYVRTQKSLLVNK